MSHLSLTGALAASLLTRAGASEGARLSLALACPPLSRKLRVLGRWLSSPSRRYKMGVRSEVLCGGTEVLFLRVRAALCRSAPGTMVLAGWTAPWAWGAFAAEGSPADNLSLPCHFSDCLEVC